MTESTQSQGVAATATNSLKAHLCEVLYDRDTLHKRVSELGAQISADYAGRPLVLIGILRGACMFLTDLSRAITIPHSWDFCAASSYHGGTASSGRVMITKDVEMDIRGKDVIVVEDIYDSGRTLAAIGDLMKVHRPRSVEFCSLLNKEGVPRVNAKLHLKYIGFSIANKFVVGYGLDYEELYRNLDCIGVLDPSIYQ